MLRSNTIALPSVLPGFENISRYWDRQRNLPAARILPGEYYVTRGEEIITTVLGSCVSACIRDRVVGIGGMNHFMLPISDGKGWGGSGDLASTATRYGNYAMEHMVNDILKNGGRRSNLEVKVFGGGQIIASTGSVGTKNIEFIRSYLATEGLPVSSEDLGDIYPRKIIYYPASGRVQLKKLKQLHNDSLLQREQRYRQFIEREPVEGEIELF